MRPATDASEEERAAQIAVNRRVSRLRREWADARLGLYREYLAAHVTSATPLIDMLERDEAVDVQSALWRFQPPFAWPDGRSLTDWRYTLRQLAVGHRVRNAAPRTSSHGGEVMVQGEGPRRLVTWVRISGHSLELSATVGKVRMKTDGGFVELGLDFALPETLATALPGRPAAEIVGHRWFGDPAWKVEKVDRNMRGSVVTVATGQVAFSMPWRSNNDCGRG